MTITELLPKDFRLTFCDGVQNVDRVYSPNVPPYSSRDLRRGPRNILFNKTSDILTRIVVFCNLFNYT